MSRGAGADHCPTIQSPVKWRGGKIDEINQSPVTNAQASALAVYYADLFSVGVGEAALDPSVPYYDEAHDWARGFARVNSTQGPSLG